MSKLTMNLLSQSAGKHSACSILTEPRIWFLSALMTLFALQPTILVAQRNGKTDSVSTQTHSKLMHVAGLGVAQIDGALWT